jgi:Transglutaminase-like superfamily
MKNWCKKWHKFTAISTYEKIEFINAFFVVLLIKIGLKVFPFSVFKRLFAVISHTKRKEYISKNKQDLRIKSVLRAANSFPFSVTCLPRALAAKFLLKKSNSILLKIGVQKNPENDQFEAHAWVEDNSGEIIIGNLPAFSYVPLWEWK